MKKKTPIFYSALMLTGVNLLLRLAGTTFQVYRSGLIGAAGVGLLQLVLSVGGMALTAGMAGIRTSTMYLTAEELGKKRPQNVRWVLSGCITYSLICSGVIAAALYRFAPVLASHWIGDSRTVGAVRMVACFLPVNCLCGVMTGYFTAANRIGTLAAVEVGEQLCSMAVTMGMLLMWAQSDPARSCQAVVLGSGVGGCMTLVTLTVLRLRERAGSGKKLPIRKRLLQTAAPLALADDLKAGISTTENLMVPKRLARYPGTADPLAAFGTVCGMVFPVLMFPAAILFALAELLIPELARCNAAGSKNRIEYLTKRSLRVALLYGCLFGGFLFLLSRELCMALYDSQDAGIYLQRFSLLAPMLYCDAITDAMTKGLGQQKICVRYNILTSAMDVALLFLLLPRFGMGGYYFSFLVTHLINFVLSLRRLLIITKIKIPIKIPVLTILCAVGAVWAASFVAPVILRAAVFALVFACLLVLSQVVGKEDVQWIKGLVKA